MIACNRGFEKMVRLLLDAGQDPEQEKDGESLYNIALHLEMKRVLFRIFVNRIETGTFHLLQMVNDLMIMDSEYPDQSIATHTKTLGYVYGLTVIHFIPEYLSPYLDTNVANLVIDYLPTDVDIFVYTFNFL